MRVQEGHAHATTRYKATGLVDFFLLAKDCFETYLRRYKSLNIHLPYELQHARQFPRKRVGLLYIKFGEMLRHMLHIKVFWENAPALIAGKWSLAYGQTNFDNIPSDINLCLDTGHLILGSKNPEKTIRIYLKRFGGQTKHVHLHENDLKSDQHIPPSKYLTNTLVKKVTNGRTWIIEKSA